MLKIVGADVKLTMCAENTLTRQIRG